MMRLLQVTSTPSKKFLRHPGFEKAFILVAIFLSSISSSFSQILRLNSPDRNTSLSVFLTDSGQLRYSVKFKDQMVIQPSPLGFQREEADFSKGLTMEISPRELKVKDEYILVHGKKKNIVFEANERTINVTDKNGHQVRIVFRAANDGIAFRYLLMENDPVIGSIQKELTGFVFDAATKAWLQPMSVAKTGWESTNPSYEEHYLQNIRAGQESPAKAGWVYPALFKTGNAWVLISETGMDGNYCATRLRSDGKSPSYYIDFPDPREKMPGKPVLPTGILPMVSPWRTITIGSLKTIVESTMGTDLAAPSRMERTDWIKPGKASWSWIISKDDAIVYEEQVRYIDLAAAMKWPYCLIDVNWDRKIGYEKMKQLVDYAAAKNVGILLWYNSAGSWNTTPYTPKSKLLTREAREAEFSRISRMGIKGVKIDFFGGDGQSVMQYYIELLEAAAKNKLLVNFHGATLPRGLQRTYPNLMTAEAVRGFEMVTFDQKDADKQPTHAAMLPFTRNVFDPMDFTPVNLTGFPGNVKRKTTAAFELALSILFQSGIQHYAESPEGMKSAPASVQEFLRSLPDNWEDIRFIDGFPGEYVALARKSGDHWYVAAINGSEKPRTISINAAQLDGAEITGFTDGKEPGTFKEISHKGAITITLPPAGGFAGRVK